jgi:hypothetical protein
MTLDSFRELFRERPPKRFGPVWHLWNLFLAVLPAITIAVVCTHVEKKRLKEMENIAEEVCTESSYQQKTTTSHMNRSF